MKIPLELEFARRLARVDLRDREGGVIVSFKMWSVQVWRFGNGHAGHWLLMPRAIRPTSNIMSQNVWEGGYGI
jgi:hypothetical protein